MKVLVRTHRGVDQARIYSYTTSTCSLSTNLSDPCNGSLNKASAVKIPSSSAEFVTDSLKKVTGS